MTYLSRPDRRYERESAEERRVEVSFAEVYGRSPCPWCGEPTRKHGPEALALGKTPGEAAGLPDLGGFKWRAILDMATASRNEAVSE